MLSRFRMELKAFSTDPFATFWSPHRLWLHLLLQDRCLTGPAKEQFAHHFLQEDRFGPEEIVRKVAELNGDDGQHLQHSGPRIASGCICCCKTGV